jgi:two-component system cell cycle sensor histidine kinase/response regulator CckA
MKTEMQLDSKEAKTQTSPRARWMVVDDNEGVLDLLADLLEALGVADVQRFHSGAAALAAFNASPNQFQFVITDFDMPGMNGIELCRRLHEVAPRLKIVLASGSGIANEAGARQCGFCGFLPKPFPAADLWRTIEAAGVLSASLANN